MYKLGSNRLFYCSSFGFQGSVTAKIISSSLKTSDLITMTYFDDKIYYLDIVFTEAGSHVFYVYENGIQKHRDILLVSSSSLLLYPEG